MLIRKTNIVEADLSEFITELEFHLNQKTFKDRYSDFIALGIEFLLQIPNSKNVSFFKMDMDSFLFEFLLGLPSNNKYLCTENFQALLDNNKIGEAIESGAPVLVKSDEKSFFENIILVLIQNQTEIFGLFTIIIDGEINEISDDLNTKLNLFSKYYANHIDNVITKKEIERTSSLLEQKVAVRTMNLAHSNREMQMILNSVNNAILVFAPDTNKVIHANSIAAQLLQVEIDKLIGIESKDIFKDNSVTSKKQQVVFSRNYESLLKFNKLNIPILRSTSNIKFGDEKMRIESFIDISERKKIEIALKKSNELLEQKVQDRTEDLQILVNKLKSEVEERKRAEEEVRVMLQKEIELNDLKSRFVSLVSHEFRTPLTLIYSAAQIILRYQDKLSSEEQITYIDRIMDTVDEMTSLIENVMFIGKNDANKMSYDPQRINVVSVAKSIIQDFLLSLDKEREIDFDFSIDDEYSILDEKLLRHILLNLFTNAVKYSDNDTTIRFRIIIEGDKVKFSIEDEGIGIPDEAKPKIFEQFFRAENVGNVSGTGLGMSVIAKSVKTMNGKIDMESQLGKGTKIIITLPKNGKGEE